MKYNPGDKVIISATVKVSDDCGDMILVESNSGEFYIEESDIAKGIESNPVYEKGMNDAWQIIQKLETKYFDGISVSSEDLIDMFGTMFLDQIVTNFTPFEVAEKIEEWRNKETIRVGDVVETTKDRGVVTYISGDIYSVLCNNGICKSCFRRKELTKTGKHIDLDSWFKEIGGSNDNGSDEI